MTVETVELLSRENRRAGKILCSFLRTYDSYLNEIMKRSERNYVFRNKF